jgi:ribosomal protein L25 (general stress protein Ctc)
VHLRVETMGFHLAVRRVSLPGLCFGKSQHGVNVYLKETDIGNMVSKHCRGLKRACC